MQDAGLCRGVVYKEKFLTEAEIKGMCVCVGGGVVRAYVFMGVAVLLHIQNCLVCIAVILMY